MPDVASLATALARQLRAAGDPARASHEKRYLRSTLRHFGTSVPEIRRAAVTLRRAHPDLDRASLLALVDDLWGRGVHECRMAAVELLEQYVDLLGLRDLGRLERLLRESGTWALVDGLAASVVGAIAEHAPRATARLDRWAADPDFWIRRASLLAELVPLREGRGDFDRFARRADRLLGDREFFVAKAIGWVLRDASRKAPDRVAEWLAPRAGRASRITLREATRRLPAAARAEILARTCEHRSTT
jgi:3-methyladenine DNA glycosylase AlkD